MCCFVLHCSGKVKLPMMLLIWKPRILKRTPAMSGRCVNIVSGSSLVTVFDMYLFPRYHYDTHYLWTCMHSYGSNVVGKAVSVFVP